MARTKLRKLIEVGTLENVFEFQTGATEEDLIDKFGNNNSISLEIGCGEGHYTISLAKLYPNRNFVGVDFKGARIFAGAFLAIEEKINNAAFLWINAQHLPDFFKTIKVDEIFITFPEPHIKRKSQNKRLVSPKFLDIYKKILKQYGNIHLKTDDEFLYKYLIEVLTKRIITPIFATNDLYANNGLNEIKSIKTRYEKHYLEEGRKIKYVEFKL